MTRSRRHNHSVSRIPEGNGWEKIPSHFPVWHIVYHNKYLPDGKRLTVTLVNGRYEAKVFPAERPIETPCASGSRSTLAAAKRLAEKLAQPSREKTS